MNDPRPLKTFGDKTYRCFFELALLVMGGKWKPIILYRLGVHGVLRFSELKRSIPEVTDRMLTRQLRELEADGLITREVYREVPPRVEYGLTSLGQGLFPILLDMRNWGADYEKARGMSDEATDEKCAVYPWPTLPSRSAAEKRAAFQG